MSSTRTPKRTGRDLYETPHWACRVVANQAAEYLYPPPSSVIDMGAGDGRIARAVACSMFRRWGDLVSDEPNYYLIDVDPRGESVHDLEHWIQGDALQMVSMYLSGRVFIVGNPPFSLADEFVYRSVNAVNISREGSAAAFLLRLNWLGSLKRSGWLNMNPPTMVTVLAPRPSFCKGATDSCEYAWIWWYNGNNFRGPHFDVAVRPDKQKGS